MSRQTARPAPPPPPPPPRWLPFAAAALIALFVALAVSSLLSDSQTSDEAIHLAAGYAHLTRGDFVLNPEHPPLAKEIAAIGPLLLGATLPVDDPSWDAAHHSAFQLPFGERFLYHNRVPFMTLLTAGRLPIVGLGALLCLTVFVFARDLFGWRAGLLSLGLCALSPNVLAHARLVTTDLAVAFFLLLAMYCLHLYLKQPTLARLALAGAVAGLTLASKFSAVVVVPVVLVVLLAGPPASGPERGLRSALVAFAGMMGVALLTLSATYGFVHLPVYFAGLAGVFTTVTGGTESYLLGRYSENGWWYYYPVTMAIKTPVPALLLFAAIPLHYAGARLRGALRRHLVLIAPLVMFGGAALAAARNVGLRHVLPLYPILFVLAGQAAPYLSRRRVLAAVLGVWYTGAALMIHPSYLAYVNVAWGGPSQGWRLVSDSNLDWGQDLIRLRRYMQRQGVTDLLLGYYGNQDPAYYGIDWQYLPSVGHIHPAPDHLVVSDRVLVAVSAMTLQGMFMPDKKLYDWLQQRTPTARIGYSILVYDVTGDRDALRRLAALYSKSRMAPQEGWARRRLESLTGPG